MPRYQKRRYYRRRGRKYRSRPVTYGQIGTKLYRDVMWLKSLINVETKELTVTSSSLTPSNTATITLLTGVAQGDDSNQRNGRSIKSYSIYFIGRFSIGTVTSATTCRCIIFEDKNSNGVVPTEAELLENAGLMAPLDADNAGSRFKILYDRYIDLSSTGDQTKTVKFYRKLRSHAKFDGTTGLQADCVSGHLYMYLKSNETTNLPSLNYTTRYMFIDN